MMVGEHSWISDQPPPESFVEQVKLALEHLYDFPYLQRHPLAQAISEKAEKPGEAAGQRLRRELIAAIETLNPGPSVPFRAPHARLYHLLHLHYVEGQTIQEAARELGLSLRQAYRDLRYGEESVAAVLWTRYSSLMTKPAPAAEPDVAQEETARLEMRPRPIDLRPLLQGAQKAVERLAQQRGVDFHVTMPRAPLILFTDPTAARQVFISVFSHVARQARPGTVHANLLGNGELAILALHYVLEPQWAHLPALEPVVMRLMERLGWILGQDDRQGYLRSITVYLLARGSTLLVIDDNEGLVQLLERYLTDQAGRIIAASNGTEGVRLAQELRPDAIVLDIMMPEVDGWEVLQTLRNHPRTAQIPVIICSVFNDPELAYSLGATVFLSKPLSRETFLDTLHRLRLL
jgi:CheY-like chemotaxis protein